MNWPTLYIVPVDLCRVDCLREDRIIRYSNFSSSTIPGDPTKALLDVNWDGNTTEQSQFESLPGVLPLGYPWESLPAEAVPLLASFQHFAAAYDEAYARLGPTDWVEAAVEASATATARLSSALAAKAMANPASVSTIAVTEVTEGDSVARALQKLGRRHW